MNLTRNFSNRYYKKVTVSVTALLPNFGPIIHIVHRGRYLTPVFPVFLPSPAFCLWRSKSTGIRNEAHESGLAFSYATKYLLKKTLSTVRWNP